MQSGPPPTRYTVHNGLGRDSTKELHDTVIAFIGSTVQRRHIELITEVGQMMQLDTPPGQPWAQRTLLTSTSKWGAE
jgi:hypothetical protein